MAVPLVLPVPGGIAEQVNGTHESVVDALGCCSGVTPVSRPAGEGPCSGIDPLSRKAGEGPGVRAVDAPSAGDALSLALSQGERGPAAARARARRAGG